ncbi:hypothetical protein DOU11_04485 [Clavibacter michiganensis subsp. michiganensis]|uniref:hypothetical protein n=1 Tax=Clavibacter michiganensis TaxID=28447 RepID=UPI0013661181|nr:hypothetical protein [Clavibacter michiganensis]MWJ84917.1 hypothetical protein [Clavibacter michiganensis subsp. michiganensis]
MKTENVKDPGVVIGMGVFFLLAGIGATVHTLVDFNWVSRGGIPVILFAVLFLAAGVNFVVVGVRARRRRS